VQGPTGDKSSTCYDNLTAGSMMAALSLIPVSLWEHFSGRAAWCGAGMIWTTFFQENVA